MPAQVQETEKDMPFPLQGIDLSQGHAYQRPLTCETGVNVRAFEPLSNRAKGGSRSGLSKYLPAQVPAGTHLIQHLNTVDPSVDSALLDWNLEWPDFTMPGTVSLPPVTWGIPSPDPETGTVATMDDPSTGARNPGRDVPVGGTGIAPNRNKPPRTRKYVQSINGEIETGVASLSVTFQSQVRAGSLLCLAVSVANGNIGILAPLPRETVLSVADSLGQTYSLAASVDGAATLNNGTWFISRETSLYFFANSLPGLCTVTASFTTDYAGTPDAYSTFSILAMEYRGVKALSPLLTTATGVGELHLPFDPTPEDIENSVTTDSVNAPTTNNLALAVAGSDEFASNSSFSGPGGSFTTRTPTLDSFGYNNWCLGDIDSFTGITTATFTATAIYVMPAILAIFKPT